MTEATGHVSVVTVVRNGERYIAEALESILAQTHPAHEIIVVDGRSADRTPEIVRGYDGVRWMQQPGQGLADARNAGVRAATGRWIAFLDHDDRWPQDKLLYQFTALRARPDAMYVMGWLEFFVDPFEPPPAQYTAKRLGTPRPGPTPGTVLIRRDAFEEVGPFDDRYAIGCDLEWVQRLSEARLPAAECHDMVLMKRLHGRNLSRQATANREDIFGVLRDRLSRRD